MKYLVGCIAALLTLVGTILCLAKQVFALRNEKKRYDQLAKSGRSPTAKATDNDTVMATERALITQTDPVKMDEASSPRRAIATDMPALHTLQTEEDMHKPVRLPVQDDDILQIEDQGGRGALSTKSGRNTGKSKNDVSPISGGNDDHSANRSFDRDLQALSSKNKRQGGLEEELETPSTTKKKRRSNRKNRQTGLREDAGQRAADQAEPEARESAKPKKNQKKAKAAKQAQQKAHGDGEELAGSGNSDLAQVLAPPEANRGIKSERARVESINDLYDEDIAATYKSPNADEQHAKKEKKLNSVIEESEEYSVTPSRPAITDAGNSKNVTPR